ncbi:hypothetical protein Aph01nite_48250 [Acrocarpospora phusangensis]|uniref:Uncharacterized protein n=1 Tax=Acrocarpospora phusangensis TaxID=1070424 RepID=A0A919QHG0_9ACTN|nr:hypothetical protein [Acrocarpospora phusangensis]GIH26515.1 hypothetical protein Aph01nite_48250 [Acrocarpospora phusangensis]
MGDWEVSPDPRCPALPDAEPPPGRFVVDGHPMHGVYRRPTKAAFRDLLVTWNGHRLWQGEEAARFTVDTSPLLSIWNLVYADDYAASGWLVRARADQAGRSLQWAGPEPSGRANWIDLWKARALLDGLLPFARLTLPESDALRWCAAAGRSGVIANITRGAPLDPVAEAGGDLLLVTASRDETYGRLFPIDAIIDGYREVLPKSIAEREIESLEYHRALSLATYVAEHGRLEEAGGAVRGLTLGHPVAVTVAQIVDDAFPLNDPDAITANGRTSPYRLEGAESVDGDFQLEIPSCPYSSHAHARLCDPLPGMGPELVEFVRGNWSPEFLPGSEVNSLEELSGRTYVLSVAYVHYLVSRAYEARPLDSEVHAYICCLLRDLGHEPRQLVNEVRLMERAGLRGKN